MPRIFIDAEVFEALADRARAWRDTPNDVIRALLALPPVAQASTPDAEDLPGQLGPLIRAGLIKPGDQITWYRRNSQETYTFTVTAAGFLADADGTVHTGPNRAATHIAGYPTKGWPVFKTPDGTTLADLVASLPNNSTQEP
ncbi:hypothetical protein [Actinospica robiniae]|uniref:restriction system modified-DNA reader domain-containing protein n=1 Tax=Actinospica robiniae TaxID=304901 RepID=UPI0004084610|nr:hypothetical protein [Actinospica robiniae]